MNIADIGSNAEYLASLKTKNIFEQLNESQPKESPSSQSFAQMVDQISSLKHKDPTPADRHSEVQGMARNYGKSGDIILENHNIDKTSELYKQSVELESYFVKVMLTSMRKTLSGTTLSGKESFAGKMYKDLMYDELSMGVTENAGFGLADQIYLELNRRAGNSYS